MKLAVQVHHDDAGAQAAGVAFEEWGAPEPWRIYLSRTAPVGPAMRGPLDLRDLPVILHLLQEHALTPDTLLIDGWVHLDAQDTPGLGWHLHQALGGRVAVIGVSKKPMAVTPAQFEVMREAETRPLVITCAGIDIGAAKARVCAMHGKRRIPTLLKRVARLAKDPAA